MHDPLVAYASAPVDEVAMVLVHPGGQRGKGLLDRLRKAGAREVKAEAPKPWQLAGWVTRRGAQTGKPPRRRRGRRPARCRRR